MAATELATGRTREPKLPPGLLTTWGALYALVWLSVPAVAALVALAAAAPARHLLDATLTPDQAPSIGHALWLAGHNIPIAAWPLLLARLEAEQKTASKRAADALLTAALLVNTLQVAVAIGAYGAAVLPFLPQVPFEWAGLTLGASGWGCQRRAPTTRAQRVHAFVLVMALMLAAAVLETFAVPHR